MSVDLEAEVLRQYLREKNEIIKAYAGPTGMTPEDVAYALERGRRIEAAARRTVDAWLAGDDAGNEWDNATDALRAAMDQP